MREIADEALTPHFTFVALQEIKWEGDGRVYKGTYMVLCSSQEKLECMVLSLLLQRKLKKDF